MILHWPIENYEPFDSSGQPNIAPLMEHKWAEEDWCHLFSDCLVPEWPQFIDLLPHDKWVQKLHSDLSSWYEVEVECLGRYYKVSFKLRAKCDSRDSYFQHDLITIEEIESGKIVSRKYAREAIHNSTAYKKLREDINFIKYLSGVTINDRILRNYIKAVDPLANPPLLSYSPLVKWAVATNKTKKSLEMNLFLFIVSLSKKKISKSNWEKLILLYCTKPKTETLSVNTSACQEFLGRRSSTINIGGQNFTVSYRLDLDGYPRPTGMLINGKRLPKSLCSDFVLKKIQDTNSFRQLIERHFKLNAAERSFVKSKAQNER